MCDPETISIFLLSQKKLRLGCLAQFIHCNGTVGDCAGVRPSQVRLTLALSGFRDETASPTDAQHVDEVHTQRGRLGLFLFYGFR